MFIRKLQAETMGWNFFDSRTLVFPEITSRRSWSRGIRVGLVYAEWQGVSTRFMPRTSLSAQLIRDRHFEVTKEVVKLAHTTPRTWLKRQRRVAAGVAFRVAYAQYLTLMPEYERSMAAYYVAMTEYTARMAQGATKLSKPKRPREPDEPILGFYLQGYSSD
jgi:hypothetical protein